jgi:cell wall-associated NlpC family hydrolase
VQLDQASQQLSTAQSRLSQVRARLNHANAQFRAAQASVAQNAAAAFEDSGATSVAGVLTSGDPSEILQQGSLLQELSGRRNAQTQQLLTDASELAGVEQQLQRTENGVAALQSQLAAQKKSLGGLITTEKATLASLTVPQQQTVTTATIGAGGTTTATYTGPTSSQADKAVAFAYAQLGKPYQWGAAGPGAYDCSGLVYAAYAAAGIHIARTTYQWQQDGPVIPLSQIQPGDLLFSAGSDGTASGPGHVVMYLGNGQVISAPQTGQDVQTGPAGLASVVAATRPAALTAKP